MNIQADWELLSSGATSFALPAANCHSAEARELILAEAQKFADQPHPVNSEELTLRYLQDRALIEINIGGISHADSTARRYPRVAENIFEEVKRLCSLTLPNS